MGLTYTRAADRDHRHTRTSGWTLGDGLLVIASIVTILAIALTYAGRTRAEAARSAGAPAPLNLNDGPSADRINAALAGAFPAPADRKAAVAALAGMTGEISHIGALTRVAPFTPSTVAALKPQLAVRTPTEFRSAVLWYGVLLVAGFHLVALVWRLRGTGGDRVLLAGVHLLVGIGFVVMLARQDPIRDTLLIARYTEGVLVGLAVFALLSSIDFTRALSREFTYVPLVLALGLSVALLVFGSGPGTSGAKVNLGPIQPIEAIRLLLAFFLAGFFARRWELLRQVRAETVRARAIPAWIHLPRLAHVLPVVAGVALALVLFFFQKDLGPALLLTLIFLALFGVARGGALLPSAGLAGLVAGFAVGYLINLSSTLTTRVAMWQSPWDNAARGGDQVAQGLWGLAHGAVAGTGLGLGATRFIPEVHTDLVLAGVGEELGFIGLLVVAAAFFVIAMRGFAIARGASSDYQFFLAIALTLGLIVPALVMAAGLTGVLPLTGVVTPFLSYGGSAMAANFAALGLLVSIDRASGRVGARAGVRAGAVPGFRARPAVHAGARADRPAPVAAPAVARGGADLAPFLVPTRWLGRAMAGLAVAVLLVAGTVQVVRADDYLTRPQMSVQADGGRRFHYNPRVLEVMRLVPRGTITDRNGEVLATNNPDGTRAYPAGDAFFHLIGDANTRANWGAPNSTFVERDAEDRLRGFDDRATVVATTDADGRRAMALRRDFTPVASLVRHRWDPTHPEVEALLARPRDVRLTIDARLQAAVAAILERALAPAGGKGAVVAIDAATGEILASVSYPWRDLDRARYGLYPPGSSFKILTAAAALRADAGAISRAFVCERVSANRVGARLPGFGPPVVDDEHDEQPHGRIDMRTALVKSCNAYFAQLAVGMGSGVLSDTAALAGIALNTSRSDDRVRANLPHAGYGQGEVVATPLRMARLAAALASDGTLRERPIVIDPGDGSQDPGDGSRRDGSQGDGSRRDRPRTTAEIPFVSPAAARLIAGAMREAVTSGTGRQLASHPGRIAGKTGTAEIDEAAPHAWFVGFAPYDLTATSATNAGGRRIAFAVVLEHGGYGGKAAAAVGGQVTSAARSLGLIK